MQPEKAPYSMLVMLLGCYTRKTTTAFEGIITHAGHAVGDRHARQLSHKVKASIPTLADAIGDHHALQIIAVIEGPYPNAGDAVRDRHIRQTIAAREDTHPNAGDAVGNCHASVRLLQAPAKA